MCFISETSKKSSGGFPLFTQLHRISLSGNLVNRGNPLPNARHKPFSNQRNVSHLKSFIDFEAELRPHAKQTAEGFADGLGPVTTCPG